MSEKTIWDNLSRHLGKESTAEDEAAVKQWKEAGKTNQKVYERIRQVWDYQPRSSEQNPELYKQYLLRKRNYEQGTRTRNILYYAVRIAAIVVLAVLATVLVQSYLINSNTSTMAYQEVSVPKGNRSSLVLPDGTKVWISNNTTLKYPVRFEGNEREVYLDGEAYLEVTHNKKRPFIVNMGTNRIKVLGTKFSVTAYSEDKLVKADLISGKIQFETQVSSSAKGKYQSYMLKPGFGIVYDKSAKTLSESKIPGGFYKYWHDGVYEFKNESFEELAQKIMRIYNIEVVFKDEYLKTKRYSGSFGVNDNIFTFMEAIKQTSVEPLSYKLEGTKLLIERTK